MVADHGASVPPQYGQDGLAVERSVFRIAVWGVLGDAEGFADASWGILRGRFLSGLVCSAGLPGFVSHARLLHFAHL